jgi:cold-inducible RNA-binding protein
MAKHLGAGTLCWTQERKGFGLMNIYVGNLPFNTGDSDLRDLFSQVGAVISARVITDRETSRSRGFGFVEMSSAEEAKQAIQRFHGYNMGGRDLTVNEAKPRR